MDQAVKDAVATLVKALEDSDIGTPRSVHVDIQHSGELPFRVIVAEEELPVPGVARAARRASSKS